MPKRFFSACASRWTSTPTVRPVRLLDATLCPLKNVAPKDVDFVVIRENTEGVYTDAGGIFKRGTAG